MKSKVSQLFLTLNYYLPASTHLILTFQKHLNSIYIVNKTFIDLSADRISEVILELIYSRWLNMCESYPVLSWKNMRNFLYSFGRNYLLYFLLSFIFLFVDLIWKFFFLKYPFLFLEFLFGSVLFNWFSCIFYQKIVQNISFNLKFHLFESLI